MKGKSRYKTSIPIPLYLVLLVFGVRLIGGTLLLTTFFDPDEFWQGPEVAHKVVFGYGALTWEWKEEIRSYIHPLILATSYFPLWIWEKIIDSGENYFNTILSRWSPRIFQCFLAAMTDFAVYFSAYFMTQNLWCSILCVVGCAMFLLQILIDSLMYGHFTLVLWNFYKVNVEKGIGSFYGTHPVHWYFTQAFPLLLASHLYPLGVFCLSMYKKETKLFRVNGGVLYESFLPIICLIFGGTILLSLQPHKEFRFILPTIPILMTYAGIGLSFMLQHHNTRLDEQPPSNSLRKSRSRLVWLVIITIQLCMMVYFGSIHQRGTLDAVDILARSDAKSVMFLAPCHSYPFYSHVHKKSVFLEYLNCSPPLHNKEKTEQDLFYEAPVEFVNRKYSNGTSTLPSHIIMFASMSERLEKWLLHRSYHKMEKIFHTLTPLDDKQDRYVEIWELS